MLAAVDLVAAGDSLPGIPHPQLVTQRFDHVVVYSLLEKYFAILKGITRAILYNTMRKTTYSNGSNWESRVLKGTTCTV